MTDPRWLNETQKQAWLGLLVLTYRGLPEFDRRLKPHDLLTVHYGIFVALSGAPGETMRLSDLADSANLSQSRLTHRLRTLVDRGDVTIEPDPEDGRSKWATLTEQGRALIEEIAPLHVEDVQRMIFDPLDDEETECFARVMSKIAAGLCDHEHFTGFTFYRPHARPADPPRKPDLTAS